MRHLLERFERLSANTLSGRINRGEIRKLRLKVDEFPVKTVILAVTNDWRSFLVIEPVMFTDFVSQLLHSLCGLRFLSGHKARYDLINPRQRRHAHCE